MKTKIRKAKEEDSEEISKLRRETFAKINGKDYSEELVKALNKKAMPEDIRRKIKEREVYCVVDKNGNILGVGDLEVEKKKIGGVHVRYDLVGKGIGTKIMDFLEDKTREKGIKKVRLYSTKYARPFYEKLGYKFIRKDTYEVEEGIKATTFVMKKELE